MEFVKFQASIKTDTISKNMIIYNNQDVIDSFNDRSKILHGIPGETVLSGYGNMTIDRFTSVDIYNTTHIIDNIWVEQGDTSRIYANVTICDSNIIDRIKKQQIPVFGIRALGSHNKEESVGKIITIDIIGFEEDKKNDEE